MRTLHIAHGGGGEPEIFGALQGEGPRLGRPSVFVRLAACNLWCRWCDTPYTWRFTDRHPHDDGEVYDKTTEVLPMDVEAVAARVLAFDCPAVVFTGGEPLLQQPALVELIRTLRGELESLVVDFETNGTVAPTPDLLAATDLFVVSAKLANAGIPAPTRITPALEAFAERGPQAAFKFVVSGPEDLDEVRALVQGHRIAPDRVYLMPEGRSVDALDSRMAWVADVCLAEGYRFSDRLHIRLSGDARGT